MVDIRRAAEGQCSRAAVQQRGKAAEGHTNKAADMKLLSGSGLLSGSDLLSDSGLLSDHCGSQKIGSSCSWGQETTATHKIQSILISGRSDSSLFAPNGAEQCRLRDLARANVRCASTTSRVLLLVSNR